MKRVEDGAPGFGGWLVGCMGRRCITRRLAARYLGEPVRSTWQMGEAAVVAERMRCPVVSDFRPADLAAGGQGAPLVPMLDWCLFRSAKVSRVLQNLGGIGNLTAIPAGCGRGWGDGVRYGAGEHGDRWVHGGGCLGRSSIAGGRWRGGAGVGGVVEAVMREGYFSALPPKSCGREEFGAAFAARFVGHVPGGGGGDADVVATATALTAESIVDAYRRFVWAHLGAACSAGARWSLWWRAAGRGMRR